MAKIFSGPRVSGALGRILNADHQPIGTCFQVAPTVLVTAHHVIAGIGSAQVGREVATDDLGGTVPVAAAKVAAVDRTHDLAVLLRAEPLPSVVAQLMPTDAVGLLTDVFATGLAQIDDPEHEYAYLDAPGVWHGGAVRDGTVAVGRFAAASVVPGMSGAPVLRLADHAVVGVVSERYNSSDGWLRDSIWVVRTEDLVPLLRAVPGVVVRERLTLEESVGVVTAVSFGDDSPFRATAPTAFTGPREAALEVVKVLIALDESCRASGALTDRVEHLVSTVVETLGCSRESSQGFRLRLRLHGLDPRLLVPRAAGHREAAKQWDRPITTVSGLSAVDEEQHRLLASLRSAFARDLARPFFSGLSDGARRYLAQELDGAQSAASSEFLRSLDERLPGILSTSREAVLVRTSDDVGRSGPDQDQGAEEPAGESAGGGGRRSANVSYRSVKLASVAASMCRLPEPDPFVAGRANQIEMIADRLSRRMAKHHRATAFLSGQPGVGTSTVAIETARALIPQFAGGVFHVDLHGLVPGRRRDARTVVRVLSEALELDLGDRAMRDDRLFAAFTHALDGRAILMVLDNVLDAEHVGVLATAPADCGVIVTSRDRLQEYADPGLVFDISPLARNDSMTVLADSSGVEGLDKHVLYRLAELCADVPLALRMVGSRLARRPDLPPAYLVQLLEAESTRLDYLDAGDRAVRATIQLSYHALDDEVRRAFKYVTAAPGSAVAGSELGYCLEQSPVRQELLLNRLVDRSLAQQEITRLQVDRLLATFTLYDLVRLFAKERLDDEEATDAIVSFQRRSVEYLNDRLAEVSDQPDGTGIVGELDPARFHAALAMAVENGWLPLATQLALSLHVLYSSRLEIDSLIGINDVRTELHLQLGEPEKAVEGCLLNADVLSNKQATDDALKAVRKAIDIAHDHQLTALAGKAQFRLSVILGQREEWSEALRAGELAYAALVAVDRVATAVPCAINNCGIALELDDAQHSLRWGTMAVELADRWGDLEDRAVAAHDCGRAEFSAQRYRPSMDTSARAAALWAELEFWFNAAVANENAANAADKLDDLGAETRLRSAAVAHWERHGEVPGRTLAAMIDLSACHMRAESYGQAAALLERAEKLAGEEDSAAAGAELRAEVHVRHLAVQLFTHEQPEAALPAIAADSGFDANAQADLTDPRVAEAFDVLRMLRAGTIPLATARKQVRSLLAHKAVCRPEGPRLHLRDKLGDQPESRRELR